MADEVASAAAAKAQLPAQEVESVRFHESLARAVRRRCAETFLDAARKDPRSSEAREPREKVPRVSLEERVRRSQHQPVRIGQCFKCFACKDTLRGGVKFLKWLETPCKKITRLKKANAPGIEVVTKGAKAIVGDKTIHESHAAMHHEELNLFFCATCGARGESRLKILGNVCDGVMPRGRRDALLRIAKGLLPGSGRKAREYNEARRGAL